MAGREEGGGKRGNAFKGVAKGRGAPLTTPPPAPPGPSPTPTEHAGACRTPGAEPEAGAGAVLTAGPHLGCACCWACVKRVARSRVGRCGAREATQLGSGLGPAPGPHMVGLNTTWGPGAEGKCQRVREEGGRWRKGARLCRECVLE